MIAVALISLGLVAGACSKDDEVGEPDTTPAATTPQATTAETTAATTAETTAATTADTTADTMADTTAETTPATDPPATDPPATDPPDTTPAGPEPVYGGSIVVSGEAEVANPWTPAAMQCDSYCQQRARSFYDPLVLLDENLEVKGFLLESWESNDDFTVWTFTVRPGIMFHDGTPLDAAAAVYNLQASGTGLLIANAIRDVGKNDDGTLAIEATGELTFTVATGKDGDLSQPLPWPNFPQFLAGQLGLIASPTWLEAVKNDASLATSPVGTGPFIVQSYASRDRLVVTRNENYWLSDEFGNQLPYLDQITYRVIEDSETAADALQSGEIDIFSTSSALVISDFRKLGDEFPMTEQSELTETNYILINLFKEGPLSDQRVRCALSMSIDRQELVDVIGGGIPTIANGLFSPGQEGYLEDNGFDPTNIDIDTATALIAEYEAETGTEVVVQYGTTVSQINAQTAELLQGYWSAIGVDTEIQQVPQDQFITNALFGVPTFFMYGWRNHAGTNIDGQYFWWHSSAGPPDGELALNFGRVNDPIVDENLEAQRVEQDPDARREFAENVNRRFAEQCYQIPTTWTLWGTPHRPDLQGLDSGFQLPDGSRSRNGAGFSGQFWVQGLFLAEG